jgi:hypothetical protein
VLIFHLAYPVRCRLARPAAVKIHRTSLWGRSPADPEAPWRDDGPLRRIIQQTELPKGISGSASPESVDVHDPSRRQQQPVQAHRPAALHTIGDARRLVRQLRRCSDWSGVGFRGMGRGINCRRQGPTLAPRTRQMPQRMVTDSANRTVGRAPKPGVAGSNPAGGHRESSAISANSRLGRRPRKIRAIRVSPIDPELPAGCALTPQALISPSWPLPLASDWAGVAYAPPPDAAESIPCHYPLALGRPCGTNDSQSSVER